MLSRARNKFILWSMISLIVIVAILITVINLVNWNHLNGSLETALTEIAASLDGEKKEEKSEAEGLDTKQKVHEIEELQLEKEDLQLQKEEGKQEKSGHGRSSAFVQYGSRYFIVTVDPKENSISIFPEQEIVTEETAAYLLEQITKSQKSEGVINEYKYKNINEHMTVFLDCSMDFSYARSLFLISVLVGIAGILLAFLFIIFVSKKIVEPVRISIEKQKQFITNAGHELKTPLSAIAMNMDILSIDLEENEWVEGTQKQVGKLRKLVENLITLSKIEEDDNAPEMLMFSVSEMTLECLDGFESLAKAQGKSLNSTIENELKINGDPGTVQQAISTLCDNAIKYSVGPEAIEIKLWAEGRNIIFQTANNWDHSIDEDNLEQLFERFYRGDPVRNTENKPTGHGLGLSIVKAIAEKNKAKLSVSVDGRGWIIFQLQMRKAQE